MHNPRMQDEAIYPRLVLDFLESPFASLDLMSTSASHLLALTSWITLMNCFAAMAGKLTMTMTQGQNEPILFARAISSAPALNGSGKICLQKETLATEVGWTGPPVVASMFPII